MKKWQKFAYISQNVLKNNQHFEKLNQIRIKIIGLQGFLHTAGGAAPRNQRQKNSQYLS